MAGSVNKVILVGNLGKDPEVHSTQAGSKIVSFTLATIESWTDKASAERKERTERHRVVVFNEQIADIAERFLTKGAKVYVEGQLQTRKWTDQGGQEHYTTEVVVPRFKDAMTMLSGSVANSSRQRIMPLPRLKVRSRANKTAAPGTGAPRPSTDLCGSCA